MRKHKLLELMNNKEIRNSKVLSIYLLKRFLESTPIKQLGSNDNISFKRYLNFIQKDFPTVADLFTTPYLKDCLDSNIDDQSQYKEVALLRFFILSESALRKQIPSFFGEQVFYIDCPASAARRHVDHPTLLELVSRLLADQSELACIKFHEGRTEPTSNVSLLPLEILNIIYSYVLSSPNKKNYKIFNNLNSPLSHIAEKKVSNLMLFRQQNNNNSNNDYNNNNNSISSNSIPRGMKMKRE